MEFHSLASGGPIRKSQQQKKRHDTIVQSVAKVANPTTQHTTTHTRFRYFTVHHQPAQQQPLQRSRVLTERHTTTPTRRHRRRRVFHCHKWWKLNWYDGSADGET